MRSIGVFTEKINPFVVIGNPFVANGSLVRVNTAGFTRKINPLVVTGNPFVITGNSLVVTE